MLLYSFRRCPFAIRVRIALHEKGIPFSVKEENLKNLSAELRSLHPQAKVPVLVDGDLVLYESAIITEYVDELRAEPKLMPETAAERAVVRRWTYWCNALFKPAVDRFKYRKPGVSTEELETVEAQLIAMVSLIDDAISDNGGWLVGGAFSLADVHVFPFFRQLVRVSQALAGLEQFVAVEQWYKRIQVRPSFEAAMARHDR